MMEPVRRRDKDKPMVDTSYQPTAATKLHQSTTFDYKNDLLIAITPLISILLAFGGKLSILVMCFGGLICYICDLVGSVEGTITTLILTMFGEVACLVWAARVFLSESMLNFSVILLMWVVLFFSFLVTCNFFVGIVNDVGIVLGAMNQLMFATLPLLSAALISWFLCVEIPTLDLLLCFNSVYFLYVLYLGKPREISSLVKKSGKTSPTTPSVAPVKVILEPHVLLLMYIIPIVMTVLMHVAVHHNVLSTNQTRVTNFIMSLLVPCLLMTYCAYKQLARPALDFHSEDAGFFANLPRYLDVSTFILSTLLVWCLDRHPIMDEIKSFSELDADMAGYAIMAAVGLVFAAFVVHQFAQKQTRILAEQSENINSDGALRDARKKLKFISIFASICIGGANALLAIVIGLPDHAIGVSIVGAMALAEYYLHPDWSFSSKCILIFIASLYSALAAASFMKMSLDGIDYNFQWNVDVTLPDFTSLVNVLIPVAIALPTLVTVGSNRGSGEVLYSAASLGILPDAQLSQGGGAGVGPGNLPMGNRVFEWVFPAVCAVVAGAELMLREQDWSDVRVNVSVVYPLYYFMGTAFIIAATSTVMYSAKAIGPSCVWIIWATQGCKMLHLIGIGSLGALTSCLLLLAYTLPFIRVISKYLRMESEAETPALLSSQGVKTAAKNSATAAVNLLELVLYVIVATVATFWAREHMIAHNILQSILARDPTDLQQTTLCLAVWLAYLGCILLVFYKPYKTLRSVVLVSAGLCMLVAMEGFGHLNLTMEQTSSHYLTIAFHPDMNVQEHPALFFALTTALSGLAWIGLIPLNSLFMCVLYSLLFGFISSKAMLSWAFPLSLADNSFTHEIFAFPFSYLYASKFLLTLVAVWNPSASGKQGRSAGDNASSIVTKGALVLACAMPFFGLLWAMSSNVYAQAHAGIEWSAVVGFVTLCGTTRLREIYNDTTGTLSSTGKGESREMSACIPCATLAVFFTSMAVFTSHGLDRDVFVPLSSLAFLCTSPGAVLAGKAPVMVVGAICAAFWTLSALYAVLVKGYGLDPSVVAFEGPQDMFHLDSDVSIWTNESKLWPLINLALVLAPLPGVISGLYPRLGRSEDIIFVLAVLSLVPVFAAQISSLRYLGIVGMLFAAWKGYRVSDLQHRSDRLI